MARANLTSANRVVRSLFTFRTLLGRLFGWDSDLHMGQWTSYIHRLNSDLTRRSKVTPGSADGPFRLLYVLDREALSEIRNATVHAFLSLVLTEVPDGYRLYWAVYVKPVSRLTPLYMAVIEPFRRFIVYPAILRRLRTAWEERYPDPHRNQKNRRSPVQK
jgi:hypothetical protein